jgi:hypothetical protein
MQGDRFSQLVILMAALACGDPTSTTQDQLTIQTTGQDVVLSNASEKPTFYFIVERGTAAVLDFTTCVEGPGCRSVASGATVRIPYRQITGYGPDRKEAIVFWWRSVPSPTGPRADGLRNIIVEL